MAKVRVYFFHGYDIASDRMLESKRPARLEVIKRMGYTPNMAKAVDVDDSKLDAYGFYTGQVLKSDLVAGG